MTFTGAILATTFGVYLSNSLSTEIRQQATRKYDLDNGADDASLTASFVIDSAKWIKSQSNSNDVLATNYSIDSFGMDYLVSITSQRAVLIESNKFEFPTLFVKDAATKAKATKDFFEQPNAISAKILTDFGVDWYLLITTNSKMLSSTFCLENQIWRCDLVNDQSVVVKFLARDQ